MSETMPGADELRIRGYLRSLGVGPAAELPATPPQPPNRDKPAPAAEDAWWDDLYGDEQPKPEVRQAAPRLPNWWGRKLTDLTADEPNEEPDEEFAEEFAEDEPEPSTDEPEPSEEPTDTGPEPAPTQPPRKRRTTRPAYRNDQPHPPRQSLLDAYASIPSRVRWLIYHATAATAGWWLGWVDWGTNTAAWYVAGHWTTPSAFALYGLGACLCALYRRSRTWAWPAAWAAAVPVSSIALGVLLYAPTQ